MFLKLSGTICALLVASVLYLQYEISNTMSCYVVGGLNTTSHEYVLSKFHLGWVARMAGWTYPSEWNDQAKGSAFVVAQIRRGEHPKTE